MHKKSIEQRYRQYITRHPWVLQDFTARALADARAGARRLSAKAYVEDMRRAHKLRASAGERFGISNSYTRSLAIDAVAQHPELAGLFEIHDRASSTHGVELDDPDDLHWMASPPSRRCPNCGTPSRGACSDACVAELDRDHAELDRCHGPDRETAESAYGLPFEGWDSMAGWR